MRYHNMGSGDLKLSEVGFGCGGNAGLMVRGDGDEQTRVVERALVLGVNYFDNSPDYGDCVAESNLGRVLRTLKVRPYLNSKVEMRLESLAEIADHVVRATEASLKRLGVDCLDVLQIHSGAVDTGPLVTGKYYQRIWIEHYLKPGGVFEGLQRLLESDGVGHVGSICRGNDILCLRRLIQAGLFDIINAPYTLLNPTAGNANPDGLDVELNFGEALNLARSHGVGTASYAPPAGGVLTDATADGAALHPLAPKNDRTESCHKDILAARHLKRLAESAGLSLAQLAYQFILAHRAVTVTFGGFSSLQQLEEMARICDVDPLSSNVLEEIVLLWESNFEVPVLQKMNVQ